MDDDLFYCCGGAGCPSCDGGESPPGLDFADPGGDSALQAETPTNPRNLPCPTCHGPNRLTPKDKARHYQCDDCADACEQGYDRDIICGGTEGGCTLCKAAEGE
jgi:hypothetical protein